MAASRKVTRTFEFEKETKNSIRLQEKPATGEPPVIGSLYVQKWWLKDAKSVKLTMEVE